MGFLGRAAFNLLHAAIGFATVLLYPLYETKRAIEKASFRDQQQQWLTYWLLLSFLTMIELYFSTIISWIPIWAYIKMVVCLWLMLPSFKGAAYVYENIAMKFMTIEREEKPESDLVREKEKEKEQEKEDGEDKEEEKEKEKKKKKEEEEAEDEEVDEQKKIFRAWKLVDDYIEKKGADSLEQIVKLGLGN
ncbi:HVA22-like protein f [Cucurbita pepo subsp. pepo]|uniref:HVA22-like protein f n=1 Tax=Cucurbita pepo subsp. pepo TaxID=3664 RepID=UPI000C9D5A20|nr:HVA22-like protein f [Cucurbita pepo subsp. pepo]